MWRYSLFFFAGGIAALSCLRAGLRHWKEALSGREL
jgi:hypothetical protein